MFSVIKKTWWRQFRNKDDRVNKEEVERIRSWFFISDLSWVFKSVVSMFCSDRNKKEQKHIELHGNTWPTSPPSSPSSISVSFAHIPPHSFLSSIVLGSQEHRHGSSHLRPFWDECKRRSRAGSSGLGEDRVGWKYLQRCKHWVSFDVNTYTSILISVSSCPTNITAVILQCLNKVTNECDHFSSHATNRLISDVQSQMSVSDFVETFTSS